MTPKHGLAIVAFVAAAVVWAGCADRDPTRPLASTQGPCGATETDPWPDEPGVFLGSCATPPACFTAAQTDRDQDGAGDLCESLIAAAFTPELAYFHADNVGREPRWVARPLGGDRVRVGYLLSYYVDLGPNTAWCNNNIVDLISREACHGHAGDSEIIWLDVYYDTQHAHWVLDQAVYSTHTTYRTYARGSAAYPLALFYPTHPGAHPRSYVAYQKHANYGSDAECDAGALFGTDDCNADTFARVGNAADIGSNHVRLLDCVASYNPIYSGNGIIECYWTERRFSGWQGFSPDAGPYSGRLVAAGFTTASSALPGSADPFCAEAGCAPLGGAYISHFSNPDCTGIESYYTGFGNNDGVRRSWNGRGLAGAQLRTVPVRSMRMSDGYCNANWWPAGNQLSDMVLIYRIVCGELACIPPGGAYISHYTNANCSGVESYYTPYFNYDGVRRSWDGKGVIGTELRTRTNRSYRTWDGVCHNISALQQSQFVTVYRAVCGEDACARLGAAYRSDHTTFNCSGAEYSRLGEFFGDAVPRSWDGAGLGGLTQRSLAWRSYRETSGSCKSPLGALLNPPTTLVAIYR